MRDLTENTRDAWARLEAWCHRHHPRLLGVLNPGASEGEIHALERVIGQPLPADVHESLSIHNGESNRTVCGFVFGTTLLSLQEIEDDWQLWRNCEVYNEEFRDGMSSLPDSAVALDYANAGWIPLTRDAGSNHIGVDLAPGPDGTAGQVINFGRDEKQKCVLAPSWGEFLLSYAKFLESGALTKVCPEVDVWGDNFDSVMSGRHRHDVLVEWSKEGRWPLN